MLMLSMHIITLGHLSFHIKWQPSVLPASDALAVESISSNCCLSLSRTVLQPQPIFGFYPHIEQTHL